LFGSLSVDAQYGDWFCAAQSVCDFEQALVQMPPAQSSSGAHVCPQAPQFALSVVSSAQYAPPSPSHKDCPAAQVDEQTAFTHASSDAHVFPHVPQFLLSLAVVAQ